MSTVKDLIRPVEAAVLELNRALNDAHDENVRFRRSFHPEHPSADRGQEQIPAAVTLDQAYEVHHDVRCHPVRTKAQTEAWLAEFFSPEATKKREEEQERFERSMETVRPCRLSRNVPNLGLD
jgi:hypothetical protein